MKIPTPLKIILCTLAVLIPGSVLAGWLYFVSSLERDFLIFINSYYPKLNIEYSDLRTNPLKKQVILDQVRIVYSKDIEIRAREIAFRDLVISDRIPVQMTVRASDMDIKGLSRAPEFIRDMERSGNRLTRINSVLKYKYSQEKNTLDVPRIILENHDLGFFCSRFALSNLNADYILSIENTFLLAAALLGVRIDYFEAGYEDAGMIKRLAELKQLMDPPASDRDYQSQETILGDLFKDRENPVNNFLLEQEPLTIRLAPRNPVPFSAILTSRSITAAAKLLGLEVSNHSPDFCYTADIK